jgi:hypothetical protein
MSNLDKWSKEAGRKPSKILIQEASTLVRINSKDCVVVAMAMRPNGVTQSEVISQFGRPHRNIIKKLLQDNAVREFVLPEGGRCKRIRLVKK